MRDDDREEIEKQLRDFEYLIKKARIKYEQFFMGNERREPSDLRGKIRGIIKNSALERHQRAAVKFRFMSLVNRFVTLQAQWDRMLRQMEEGTFDYRSFRGFIPRVAREDGGAPQRATAERHDVSREVIGAGDLSNDSLDALAVEAASAVESVEKAAPDGAAPPPPVSPASEAAASAADKPDLQSMLDHLVVAPPPPPPPPTATAHRKLSLRPPKAKRPEPARPSVEKPVVAKAEAPKPLIRPSAEKPVVAKAEAPKPLVRPSARHRPAPERIDEKPAPAAAPVAAAAAATPPPVPAERTPEKRLYEKYMTARQRTGKADDGLAFQDFEKRIAKKRDLLKKKFDKHNFEFDVVTKEGKVRIVAKKK
jgi:hypothetical protein